MARSTSWFSVLLRTRAPALPGKAFTQCHRWQSSIHQPRLTSYQEPLGLHPPSSWESLTPVSRAWSLFDSVASGFLDFFNFLRIWVTIFYQDRVSKYSGSRLDNKKQPIFLTKSKKSRKLQVDSQFEEQNVVCTKHSWCQVLLEASFIFCFALSRSDVLQEVVID